MTCRVEYKPHWPDAIRPVVEEALARGLALGILPHWLEDLWVYWDGDEKDCPIHVDVDPCYLNAKLIVCTGFVETDPETRLVMLVHEFFHVHTAPLVLAARDIAGEVKKGNEALGERYEEEVRRANERVATTLESAFSRARREGRE
jgi:hypothetical protein